MISLKFYFSQYVKSVFHVSVIFYSHYDKFLWNLIWVSLIYILVYFSIIFVGCLCLVYKLSTVNLTDILVCPFLLEFPICKYMCIWVTCVRWICSIWFSVLVSSAPIEWATSRLHSLVGCEHIYLQCGFCIPELETWEGNLV